MRKISGSTLLTVSLIAIVLLSGCLVKPETPVKQDVDTAYTQAAQTIVAEMTLNAPVVTEAPAEAQAIEPIPTESLPPTSTPVPTEKPAPTESLLPTETLLTSETISPTEILDVVLPEPNFNLAYEDDFSFALGWPTGDGVDVHLHYTRGGYSILNKVTNDVVWSTRSQQFSDMRVEVTGSRIEGDLEGYYGVICRFADGSNYYVLAVSSNGSYMIGKQKSGMLTYLIEGRDDEGSVNTGNAPNLIRGDCLGNTLTLYANGTLLASVEDNDFTAGAAGVAVGTKRNPGYEAFFDDYKVYIPE